MWCGHIDIYKSREKTVDDIIHEFIHYLSMLMFPAQSYVGEPLTYVYALKYRLLVLLFEFRLLLYQSQVANIDLQPRYESYFE